MADATTLRSYFTKVNGNYDQLSAEDKAAYTKLAGGEDKGQKTWDLMKNGLSGAPGGAKAAPGVTSTHP